MQTETTKQTITVNDDAHSIHVDDSPDIQLTVTEYEILKNLVKANGSTLARNTIFQLTDRYHASTARIVDSHIKAIRKKLQPYTKTGLSPIATVHGIGYRFASEAYDGQIISQSQNTKTLQWMASVCKFLDHVHTTFATSDVPKLKQMAKTASELADYARNPIH